MAITQKVSRAVRIWLIIGVIMVFGQVFLGGVTRLTGSGLSITEWKPIMGTLPPMNGTEWDEAFRKYREATTQFEVLNQRMTLSSFKWIFFWEYFHRLWARIMGFVFLFPFLFFWWRKMLPASLMRQLGWVILSALLAATFGWLMVWTGIKGNPLTNPRAWVNAYALSGHLLIGFTVFGTLWWATIQAWQGEPPALREPSLKRLSYILTIVTLLQIVFGGWMSGMKAGLLYPTFPLMNGELIPTMLSDMSQWTSDNFTQYDKNGFAPTLIQVLHRFTAYALTALIIVFFIKARRVALPPIAQVANYLLMGMLIIQVSLGIWTLVSCVGHIPVGLGEAHQLGALVLFGVSLLLNYQFINGRITN